MQNGQKQIILLTGPPGAGKGTQAEMLAEKHGMRTFSVGALLRASEDVEIKRLVNSGVLLPAETTVKLVVDEINSDERSVIVDGFPRRVDQAEQFDRYAAEHEFDFLVVVLMISQDESWDRVKARGRADDARETWEFRWREYYEHTQPSIDRYHGTDKLREIDGGGPVEEVTATIEEVLAA